MDVNGADKFSTYNRISFLLLIVFVISLFGHTALTAENCVSQLSTDSRWDFARVTLALEENNERKISILSDSCRLFDSSIKDARYLNELDVANFYFGRYTRCI
jgi:hypothetical protein